MWTKTISSLFFTFLLFAPGSLLGQSGAQQTKLLRPTPIQDDASLHHVQFVDQRTGWAVGDHGVIWRTRDGGENWQLCRSPVTCPLRRICFLTNRVGWIVGGGTTSVTRIGYGVILATKDGGETWTQLETSGLPRLHNITFFDLNEGIAVGDADSRHPTGVLFTDNGGITWRNIDGKRTNGWRAADFLNPDVGVVAGLEGRTLIVGGRKLMQPRVPKLGNQGIHDIKLQANGGGWLVGDGGLVLTTRNGGISWQTPQQMLPQELRDIVDFRAVASRGSNVWIAGNPGSVIWYSNNGGRSWMRQFSGQPQPIHALSFVSDQLGWAVGAMGLMLRTDDGGQTWSVLRGGNRRAALLSIHARPSQVSFQLLAKYSREYGYRSTVALIPRQELAQSGAHDLDLRLHEAVTESGGSDGEVGWRLPMTIPGLDRNAERLKSEWQRHTDGRLSDVLVGTLVAKIRTWRPSVIILSQPNANDALTQLINDAVLEATKQASEATRFARQYELAGLKPWQVQKVYMHVPTGSAAHAKVEPDELLNRLGRSVHMASIDSYAKLLSDLRQLPRRDLYRLVVDQTQSSENTIAAGSFFTGIPIPSGSSARRQLEAFDESQLERLLKLAQRQRNVRAIVQRLQDQPQAGRMVAEIEGIIRGMSDDQAAWQLTELANAYRISEDWGLVEATLVQLVQRFPDQPAAHDGMRRLFQLWSSAEVTWQRTRNSGTLNRRFTNNQTIVRSNVSESIRNGPRSELERPIQPSALETQKRPGQLKIGANDHWRLGAKRNWSDQAIKMASTIRQKSPGLFSSPEIEFPLAALLRQRATYQLSDRLYRGYQRGGDGDPWKQSAMAELWLTHPAGLPPKKLIACKRTTERPILDGVLSDECWRIAEEIRLKESPSEVSSPSKYTFVMMAHDDKHLYLAASIPRQPGAPIDGPQYEGRQHDADLREFDRVTFFLDTDRDYATSYRIDIDQRGWATESCWGNRNWNPKLYIAVDADKTHWRIEVAIPFEELVPAAPFKSSVWAVGVLRTVPAIRQQSWPPGSSLRLRPETFGLVRFE